MAFCVDCGTEIPDKSKFCPFCGAQQSINNSEPATKDAGDIVDTAKSNAPNLYGSVNLQNLAEEYIIDNRYTVKEKLGQGGFASVYRVYDKNFDVYKALKVFTESFSSDKEAVEDLRTESKIMMNLTHDCIVRIYDVHTDGPIKYIDMELVEGIPLSEYKLQYDWKKIPEEKAIEIGKKIAEGLQYAHEKRVIHKDIKPQNILITEDEGIKITDFGISETVRTSMSRVQNNSSSGTLAYMPPEQISGEELGFEADIYSFGALMYELLSGKPPFHKGDLHYQIFNVNPKNIDGVSDKMNGLLQQCLEKNYKVRFNSFSEIQSILHANFNSIEYKTTSSQNFGGPCIEVDKGSVSVELSLSGKIYIDGIEVGYLDDNQTKTFEDITVGKRTIDVYYKNGLKESKEVIINPDDNIKVFFSSSFGGLRIRVKSVGGQLLLDGKKLGDLKSYQSATINNIESGKHLIEIIDNTNVVKLTKTAIIQENKIIDIQFKDKDYNIGDLGPGKGLVFYDQEEYINGWRYLECASNDLTVDESDHFTWGPMGVLIGTDAGIGAGGLNTKYIVDNNNSKKYAAASCFNYSINGCNDWFLPSKDELDLLYQYSKSNSISSFNKEEYWSSTEKGSTEVWCQNFRHGNQYINLKFTPLRVRPIRAF